jgi:hypothetical protein
MHLALIINKMENKTKKLKRNFLIFLIISLFIIASSSSSITLSSVTITPSFPKTTDLLNCSWSIDEINSGAIANVTWYKDGIINMSINETSSLSSYITSNLTRKGETWKCSVIVGNDTDSSSRIEHSVTIQNSPPSTPFLQYEGINIGDYFTLIEHETYIFILNTSDPDGDPLNYFKITSLLSVDDDYCDIANVDGIGIITCTPDLEPNLSVNDRYRFLADDGEEGGIVGTSIYFNVTPVNDIPYFVSALQNITISEGEILNYQFTVADEEHNLGPYYYNISSQYYDERLNLTANENNFLVKFQNNRVAQFSDRGNHTVYLNVCDPVDYNLCINDSFNLEVIPINQPPVLSLIPNASGTQNELFTLYVNATDLDESNLLTFYVNVIECGYDPWEIIQINSVHDNATALINMTLNNSHILCPNITISVYDGDGGSDSQNIYLNLTNVNDPPVIYEMSYSLNNSHGNNLSKLVAYLNIPFTYQINGTDPDLIIDPLETLTYSDNSSLCGENCPLLIISSTGLINQTFTQVGNFSYEINLTDYYMISTSEIMWIDILNNSLPYFMHNISNLSVYDDERLYYKMNATDPDGTPINFTDNSLIINITNEGLINHTYSCEEIGNYSIEVTITDQIGAQNSTSFNLEIIHKPKPPIIYPLGDPWISPGNTTIWDSYPFKKDISLYVEDPDILCSKTNDSFTYTSRFVEGTTLFNISEIDGTIGFDEVFIPSKAQIGSYVINITVFDSYGLNSSILWNLTIGNRSVSPVINNITPHGTPINLSWAKKTDYPLNITHTTTTENTTIHFDHNTTDPENDPLVFNWTMDGNIVSYNKNYSRYFGFDDEGIYNVTLTVSDNATGLIENSVRFTWNLTILNLNRPPGLNSSHPNITINATTVFSTYLTGGVGNIRFYDPDGDILSYNHSSLTVAEIIFEGNDMRVVPLETGFETFWISASDGYLNITSYNITINVTGVPNSSIESNIEERSGGSSISSSIGSRVVPFSVLEEVEIEKEVYLDILNPEPVVIYGNDTLRQVITLVNSGNKTLRGIKLSAETNSSTAKIWFSNDYIAELLEGESVKTDLVIEDYKIYNNYEVVIYANVSDPFYNDKAVIYVNALEKSRGDQSVTSTKITFANDLLSSNPECIELNEYLKRARNLMDQGDYDEASQIIDAVIQGCKYLLSQSKIRDERPMPLIFGINLERTPYLKPVLIAFFLIIIVSIILTLKLKKTNEKEEQD